MVQTIAHDRIFVAYLSLDFDASDYNFPVIRIEYILLLAPFKIHQKENTLKKEEMYFDKHV